MYNEFAYAMEEVMGSMAMSLMMNAGSSLMELAVYIFTSLGLYSLAKRREIKNAWLAWFPVARVWTIGSIADQYRYVTKGENRNKRKVLLTLNIISILLSAVTVAVASGMLIDAVMELTTFTMDVEELILEMVSSMSSLFKLLLPVTAVGIATKIVLYMSLYDIYESCDPSNKVLYLVIGIFVGIAQAIFLFICRNKDGGMPPRKGIPQAPQYGGQYQQAPYQAPAQPWQAPQPQPEPQAAQPIGGTEELQHPNPNAPYKSPYGDFPDPYAPQHPEQQ